MGCKPQRVSKVQVAICILVLLMTRKIVFSLPIAEINKMNEKEVTLIFLSEDID